MCMGVWPTGKCSMCVHCPKRSEKDLDLELLGVMSCDVGAGNKFRCPG